ncbi:MAG: DEAD/DEAH box helicase [Rhodocyclaceae bacterium]|nr:MAG: DEAD/DEAH box helicase [Rhodocyclaceae bacterium]
MDPVAALAVTEDRAILKNGKWCITCRPDVAMKIKRIFTQIPANQVGTYEISDTPENARDLIWAATRWPIKITPRSRALVQAAEQQERETRVSRVLAPGYVAPTVSLAKPLRPYQCIAVELVLANRALLLADDLGLGKTASGIGMIARPEALPTVVVTMTHLTYQWKRELGNFAPELNVHVVTEGKPYDLTKGSYDRSARRYRTEPMPDVIVLNYHKLEGWAQTLVDGSLCRALIFDEAQELRHSGTARYNAAKLLRTAPQLCMGLTATPIYGYGGEFYNVMEIISPGCLGTSEEFDTHWCGLPPQTDKEKSEGAPRKRVVLDPTALGAHMQRSGLMLRRSRADVKRELPGVQRIMQYVDTDRSALLQVRKEVAEFARVLLSQGANGLTKMQAARDFDWKLRQATGIAKAVYVAHFVRLLVEQGEKVVLFGHHHAVYSLWRDLFRNPQIGDLNPAFYTGDESPKVKERELRRFIDGDTPIFIIANRAGAGLDGLQHVCRTVVIGELDWAPAVHEQGEGRVARDGQKEPVTVYYLLSNDEESSDPFMLDVNGIKSVQLTGIINPNAPKVEIKQVDPHHVRKMAERFLASHGRA